MFPSLVVQISLEMKRRLIDITLIFLAIVVARFHWRKKPPWFLHSCIYEVEKESKSSMVTSMNLAQQTKMLRQLSLIWRNNSVIWFVSEIALMILIAACSQLDF